MHGLHKVSYSYQITEWQQPWDSTPLPRLLFFSIKFCTKTSPSQVVVVKKYHQKEICHPNFNRVSATSKLFISNSFNPFQPLAVSLPKSSQLVKKSLDMKAMPWSPALLWPLSKHKAATLRRFQPLGLPETQTQNQPDSSALSHCILSH